MLSIYLRFIKDNNSNSIVIVKGPLRCQFIAGLARVGGSSNNMGKDLSLKEDYPRTGEMK